jgi:NDP-sugar pyrophosphorylase family protein
MGGMEAAVLRAEDFFDLSKFEHAGLFEGTEYVWEALSRLEKYVEEHLEPAVHGKVMEGAVVEGPVFIGPDSVVEPGALVRGPTIIGAGCEIRQGSYIRGHVIVGDGAVVGHATELRASVLLNGAKAPHFNYVGDSILGADCNLGAGSICSNMKVTLEPVVIRVEGREYDTGLLKLGAIVGDEGKIGCNAVLNPGTLLGKRSLAYPCSSLQGYYPPDSVIKLRQTIQVVERAPPWRLKQT